MCIFEIYTNWLMGLWHICCPNFAPPKNNRYSFFIIGSFYAILAAPGVPSTRILHLGPLGGLPWRAASRDGQKYIRNIYLTHCLSTTVIWPIRIVLIFKRFAIDYALANPIVYIPTYILFHFIYIDLIVLFFVVSKFFKRPPPLNFCSISTKI